jgi:hypothetical protein
MNLMLLMRACAPYEASSWCCSNPLNLVDTRSYTNLGLQSYIEPTNEPSS